MEAESSLTIEEALIMSRRYEWTEHDLETVKKILKQYKGRTAHKKVLQFLTEVKFPFPAGTDRAEWDQKIGMAEESVWQLARGRRWVEKQHDARIRAIGWTDEKKKLFRKLTEDEGRDFEEVNAAPEFRGDWDHYESPREGFYNYMRDLDIDMAKRKRTRAAKKKAEENPLNSEEESTITRLMAEKRFVTLADLQEAFASATVAKELTDRITEALLKRLLKSEYFAPLPGEPVVYLSTHHPYKHEEVFRRISPVVRARLDRFVLEKLRDKHPRGRGRKVLEPVVRRRFRITAPVFHHYIEFLIERNMVLSNNNVYALAPAVHAAVRRIKGFREFDEKALRYFQRLYASVEEQVRQDMLEIGEEHADFSTLSLGELAGLAKSDLAKKTDPEVALTSSQRILFLNLALIGHQATDLEFLAQTAEQILSRQPENRPTLVVLHGAIAGSFLHEQVKRKRTLSRPLTKIGAQLEWMRKFIETLGLPYIYVLGAHEDQLIVSHYAMRATLEEHGMKGVGLSAEVLSTVARYNAMRRTEAYARNEKLQQHTLYPYVLRTMRNLRNLEEMIAEFDLWESERDLLIRASETLRRNRELDEDCQRVLNVPFLKNTDERRVVESLRLRTPDGLLYLTPYVALSSAAAYKEPLDPLRHQLRKLLASLTPLHDVPDFFVTANDGSGGWCLVPPSLIGEAKRTGIIGITLPGSQNEDLVRKLGVYHGRVQQDRIAKAAASGRSVRPGALEKFGSPEHPFIAIDNRRFREVRTATADTAERVTIAMWHDVQLGLDQARFDLALKYLDYTLFHLGAEVFLMMGDLGNFVNYLSALTHNTSSNLPGVDLPLQVLTYILERIYPAEFSRGLKKVRNGPGNHEWNTPPRSFHLDIQHLRTLHEIGRLLRPDVDFRYLKKIDLQNRKVPIVLTMPFGIDKLCGLNVAYAHLWSGKFRQGAIPTQEQEDWALAHGARGVDIMVAGHQASAYGKLNGDRLHTVWPGFEEPTDFTLAMHQAQNTCAGVIHLSTAANEPPTFEFITRAFLEDYECQSPLMRGPNRVNELIQEACDYARSSSQTI